MRERWVFSGPVAHRGLHGTGVPENSLGAFEAAAAAGYAIELDVHLSADGQVVVMHDPSALRMTGRDVLISTVAAAELGGLRLDGTEEGVPVLREVFDLVAGRVPVLVEVKAGNPVERIGAAVVAEIRRYRGEVAVQSFDPRIVLWLRRHAPEVVRGQLSGSMRGEGLPLTHRLLLRSMLLNVLTRPDFLAYEVTALPNVLVSLWRWLLRAPLLAWTVRTPDQLEVARRTRATPIFEGFRPG
ncbi:glycerophosphodiester phosphodiesterase family protein [Actinokineospora enzanensis]|uniref:glycerophosphodiester phosphodiesterase family protein n=1 Tax=Actinokineospora enzanensis TaxID=155975 RepID=UPI00037A103B|nr:glycerophosphodiester phosphodiesterase family protein [Actinokineospora enzanensis]